MKTWTCNNFKGHYPVGTAAVVSAETVEVAIIWLEKELNERGLPQTIQPVQLIPMVTSTRKVRILCDGNY